MTILVVPGICRFAVHGTILDRPWVNVLDMHIDSEILEDRNENIEDQAKILLNEYYDEIRPEMSVSWTVEKVTFVDLDQADGITGERSTGDSPRVFPAAGTQSASETVPGSVCALVSKRTTSARGKRSGRMFLPASVEGAIVGQNLTSSKVTTLQAAMNAFLTAINQEPGQYSSELVVVHITGGVPSGTDAVTALEVNQRLATQRRRLRA
jgi:hypothetical protein